jgi:hypothetical protein
MSVTDCMIRVTDCMYVTFYPVTDCMMSVTDCMMSVTDCMMSVTDCMMSVTDCMMSVLPHPHLANRLQRNRCAHKPILVIYDLNVAKWPHFYLLSGRFLLCRWPSFRRCGTLTGEQENTLLGAGPSLTRRSPVSSRRDSGSTLVRLLVLSSPGLRPPEY